MFKITTFFIIALFTLFYVKVDMLLTYGILLLHDDIISLRGEVWDNEISLAPPLVIVIPVPSQESDRSCICVRNIDFAYFYDFSIGL